MIVDKYLRQVVEESHHKGEITISMINKAEELREKNSYSAYLNNMRSNIPMAYQQSLAAQSNYFGLYSSLFGNTPGIGSSASVRNKGYTYCPHCGHIL